MDIEARKIYPEPIADFMMCDGRQEETFDIVGNARAPFAGISDWPWLDEAIAVHSQRFLDRHGEEEWLRQGGQRDNATGAFTFRASSPMVARIVRTIANKHGGLLYRDDNGEAWAVRLLPGGPRAADTRIGLAVNWYGSTMPLDSHARNECLDTITDRLNGSGNRDEDRVRLEQMASRLRLCGRAVQALSVVQRAVRTQCRSLVVLPDVTLASAIWGGYDWPDNWRQDCFNVLVALSHLRIQRMRLAAHGWLPNPDLHSVAVAAVERRERSRPARTCLEPGCPLRGSGPPHGHFIVQTGLGLLGVLDSYGVQGGTGERIFDFSKPPTNEAKRQLRQAGKGGQLVTVSVPTKLFGRSNWSQLSPGQYRIIQALIGEIVRPAKKTETQRNDGAEVFLGNRVPSGKTRMSICPHLDAHGAYVSFNGNGKRRGRGYRLVGHRRTGWLFKCGYRTPKDIGQLQREAQQFLTDLDVVAGILGLVVVGYHGREGCWNDFTTMRSMADSRTGLEQLERLELRVYGPADYHDRLHGYYEQQGQMTIPRINSDLPAPPGPEGGPGPLQDLQVRMHQLGVSKADLAEALNYSHQFVSNVLNGKRAWPPEKRAAATRYLDSVQAAADRHGGEC